MGTEESKGGESGGGGEVWRECQSRKRERKKKKLHKVRPQGGGA